MLKYAGVPGLRRPGRYLVSAFGSRGGAGRKDSQGCESGTASQGGYGAYAYRLVSFDAGTSLKVVVGQEPGECTDSNCGGGGGGGSFVWDTSKPTSPILAVGGGGGASFYSTSEAYWGGDGQKSPNGQNAVRSGGGGGSGGTGGYQPNNNNANHGGGGGGWKSDGICYFFRQSCGGGHPRLFEGGVPATASYATGGFGGGGAGGREGGGGGGFSGGGAGQSGQNSGGGGGGTYSTGLVSGQLGGINSDGPGMVMIEQLPFDDAAVMLTSCGAQGSIGPSANQCSAAYSGSSLHDSVTVARGIQRYVVDATGTWQVTAYGASGGAPPSLASVYGGKGAKVSISVDLVAGDVLMVVVGQHGGFKSNHASASQHGGAGGGGSFVWLERTPEMPLVVAGGGGGASFFWPRR